MVWVLEKVSEPGWTKDFDAREEAVADLRLHICADCMRGEIEVAPNKFEAFCAPPSPTNADEMLVTPCGCEFDLYEELPRPMTELYQCI